MDLNHGLLKYIVAKVLTLGFEHNIIFFCLIIFGLYEIIVCQKINSFGLLIKCCQNSIGLL